MNGLAGRPRPISSASPTSSDGENPAANAFPSHILHDPVADQIQQEVQTLYQRGDNLLRRRGEEIRGLGEEIRRLQTTNDALVRSNSRLSIEKCEALGDYDQLKADHSKLGADHAKLEADHSKLEADHKQLEADHKKLGDDSDRLGAFLNEKLAEARNEKKQVEVAHDELEKRKKELQRQLKEAQDLHRETESKAREDLATCQRQSSQLEADVAKLQADQERSGVLERTRANLDDAKIRNLGNIVKALWRWKQNLSDVRKGHEIEANLRKKEIARIKQQVTAADLHQHELQVDKEAALKEVETLNGEIKTVRSNLQMTKTEKQALEKTLKARGFSLEHLEKELQKNGNDAKALKLAKTNLDRARTIAANNLKEKQAADRRSAGFETKLSDVRTELTATKAKLKQSDSMAVQLETAKQEIQRLRNADQQTQSKLQAADQRIEELQKDLDQEFEEARKKFERVEARQAEREGQKRQRSGGDVDEDDLPIQKRPRLTKPCRSARPS